MLKQKIKKIKTIKLTALAAAILLIVAAVPTKGFGALAATCSSSSDCQQQIDSLNAQNAQNQQSINVLQAQASSYQDAINKLEDQINQIQQQIVANQQQQAKLQTQMQEAQIELDHERQILASNIKAMYMEGDISTLEMLASSKNISDFVDKQQYRSIIRDSVKQSADKVEALKFQLQQQNNQVEQLLKTQEAQRSKIAADEDEQARLLSFNEGQQSAYNQQIQDNKKALSQLYAQQAAIIAASFGGGFHYGGTGGYPYADAQCLNYGGDCGAYGGAPFGPYAWGYPPSNEYDGAGWAYRNCTGYAFWRLAQTTGTTLDASLFPAVYNSGGKIKYSVLGGDFQNLGYRVDHDPSGDAVLAVNTGGYFGHIMYVESVVSGQAVVSQYNAAGDGLYSTGTLQSSSSIWFVHIR